MDGVIVKSGTGHCDASPNPIRATKVAMTVVSTAAAMLPTG
jgi:hypothetical protein